MEDRLKANLEIERMHVSTHVEVIHKTSKALLKATNNKKIEEDLKKLKLKPSFENQDLEHSWKTTNLLFIDLDEKDL